LLGSRSYTTKIDMWAAGCILWEMLVGKTLFQGFDPCNQLVNVVMVLGSPSVYDLWALQLERSSFPPISALSFHSILPDKPVECDLLSRLLTYNSQKRLSAQQTLGHTLFEDIRSKHLV